MGFCKATLPEANTNITALWLRVARQKGDCVFVCYKLSCCSLEYAEGGGGGVFQ